jgi:hypothetical protein
MSREFAEDLCYQANALKNWRFFPDERRESKQYRQIVTLENRTENLIV